MPSSPLSPPARLAGLDLLKLCLALLVVTIHANPLRGVWPEGMWLLGNGLARVAVPGFFVVAGYLFRPEVPGRSWRMAGRYLKLHLIWLTLYAWAWWPSVAAGGVAQYLDLWLRGFWQLWFLTALAVTVAGAALVWRWPLPALVALCLALFAAGYGLQLARIFHLIPNAWWPAILRNGVFVGLPFFLAGHLVRRLDLAARLGFRPALGLGLVALAAAMAETLALGTLSRPGAPLAPETLIAALIAGPLLLIAALNAPPLPDRLARLPLGMLSAGIYFLHIGFVIALQWHAPDLFRAAVYLIAVTGSGLITLGLIRSGLAKHLF